MDWNIQATAFMRKERALLKLMPNFDEFKGSGYRDVLLGRLEDVHVFLDQDGYIYSRYHGKSQQAGAGQV